MHQRSSFSAWRIVAAAAAAFALTLPAMLPAQGPGRVTRPSWVLERPEDPSVASVRPRAGGFSLFGNADFAVSGLRMSGNHIWGTSNLGPCAEGQNTVVCGYWIARGGFIQGWFSIDWVAGAPVHEFRKIRNVYPGVGAAIGSQGYTYMRTSNVLGRTPEWGPKDGTLGTLFSGVASTSDGSCRDHSANFNGAVSTNVTLLAVSDCPETWGPSGFQGARVISDSAFIRAFNASPATFSFDHWRVAPGDVDPNSRLGDMSAVGATNDYYAEALASYGAVTPRGTGAPIWNGYPLGLDIEFTVFNFQSPQLASVAFQQVLVINRSAEVYGTGIDYDSLYMGVQPNPYFQNSASFYFDVQRNTLMHNYSSNTAGCNGATRPPGVSACLTGTVRGFYHGAAGIIMLKSPIGDMRNKLLSRPGPFFTASSPFKDDTITFNQGRMCGFGTCEQTTQAVNDRRGFGTLASQEEATLDGRDPATIPGGTLWDTFRAISYDGSANAAAARYNRYAPPGWDYDNDGDFDTLSVDTCSPAGCVPNWADTMPGKQVNRYGNVGGHFAAGPFKLGAGDTTSFIMAFVVAEDSTKFETYVNNAVDAYMNFFLGPQPAPPPVIVAATTTSAETNDPAGNEPEVRITFTDAPETYVDPYLTKFAATIESDVAFATVNALNPWLADSIRTVASNNFSELWIFKSCDGGLTFTSDADCDGDVTEDPRGNGIAGGWQPYFIIEADANGNIANNFIDPNVEGGITYLYSLVTRTRGFRASILDSIDGELRARELLVADTITSSIQTTGPTTSTVYVPISLAAGGTPSTATVTVVSGGSTLPIRTTVLQNAQAGDYRLVFGNRFIVEIVTDTVTGAVTSTVVVQDTLGPTVDLTGAAVVDTGVVIDADTLSGPGRLEFSGVTLSPTVTRSGQTRIERDTIFAFGFALARGNAPYFVSTSLGGSAVTPTNFQNRADFPGLFVSFNLDSANVLSVERVVQASGDTVNQAIVNSNAVNVLTGTGQTRRVQGSGLYEFRFRDDSYGPSSPFQFDTPDNLQPIVVQSLTNRVVATTASTDTAIARRVYTAMPTWNGLPLVAAKFPFTVVAPSGNPTILAMVQRDQLPGGDNRITLGSGPDTATITVPADLWVPGDLFVVLEVKQVDSLTAQGRTVIRNGQVVQRPDTVVAFAPFVLGCSAIRPECNPIRFGSPGFSGYLPFTDGWKVVADYPLPVVLASEIVVSVESGEPATGRLTRADLDKIRVVPNPYIVQSQFDRVQFGEGQARLYFTGVPQEGSLRIYSISGQFLQQLRWTPADLNGTGDLQYDLTTREGTELATGLYLYVITPGGANRNSPAVRGKFVVIR